VERVVVFNALRPLGAAILVAAAGCQHRAVAPVVPAAAPLEPLTPSPRLIVGRILDVDRSRGFAFVDLAGDAPAAALADGTELIVRTLALRETGRIRVSRYLRGRTLGATIVAGQPAPGDEVVWLAP